MPCKSLQNPTLPMCMQTLRPLPADVLPGDHLKLETPERWRRNLQGDECLCDTPHLELRLTPLGAPVEINWGTANHRLCLEEYDRRDLFPHAHPGIVAEVLFVTADHSAYVALVLDDLRAADHVLSLAMSFRDQGRLVEAQHLVRAARAGVALRSAIGEIQR